MAKFEQGILLLGTPLGHETLTVSTAAVPLPNLPAVSRIRRVLIRSLGQPVNYRDDGTAPTSTSGFPLLADDTMVYEADGISDFQLIRASDATGDADVRIAYYGL